MEIKTQNKITQGQVKKIHAMLNELRISDNDYRAMLKSLFNAETCLQLTLLQANKFIEKLNSLYKKQKSLTPVQLSKINHLATEVYKTNTYKRLKECIMRNIGYDVSPGFLTVQEASKIIYILEEIKKWQKNHSQK